MSSTQTVLEATMEELRSRGDEKVRSRNAHSGAGDNQYGVPMGDIRKVAKPLKKNHELALALWKTGNADARLLATLVVVAKQLSIKELESMVRDARFVQLAEWLMSYVVKQHPDREEVREGWMDDRDPWVARAGWALTAERIGGDSGRLEVRRLLDRIEKDMPKAPPESQWTMNACLAGIGIHHVALRERALSIGERLGIYRDYPVSKGCTSPFAPVWIKEMVKRKG